MFSDSINDVCRMGVGAFATGLAIEPIVKPNADGYKCFASIQSSAFHKAKQDARGHRPPESGYDYAVVDHRSSQQMSGRWFETQPG
jgi:hypothetical protein